MLHFYFQWFKHVLDCLCSAIPHWEDEAGGKAHAWLAFGALSSVT